ncbi:class I SAM-dependent methyltransferase [Arthrobacter gengyunqii]|uniref:Class I SAM-dependent methyltransferase n=1 Tax=Arthrobacter gengyunqii TaxID=2886940 RepID=A0A9X1M553_9MICC|nr:class I SAM-dependent methyltransferase [Arthrobacter gengyunqii]MCC3270454.1 class I SAM-dependent methyltransferase [Arthrobacter gengyunqii]UOY97639.1 class I SAM-dependent methyltransferase [Arthrobacter gengyunqii]
MSAADFYTGIIPDVYTALRGATFEAGRYLDFVEQTGQPALELGCGDDGPFLELVRMGFDIDGIDSSQDMLDRCHARAAAENLRITTYRQLMQHLKLPRTYRSIYLAGPTFNLLPDDDAAMQALQGIAGHLQKGGAAMVPLWIPCPTAMEDIGRAREATVVGGATARYTVESEKYDDARRTRRTHTLYELETGSTVERVRREWIIHWHTPEGFTELAHAAGLEVTYGDLDLDSDEFTAYLTRAESGVSAAAS